MIAIGVDLQNDFMDKERGSLYVPGSEEIKKNVAELVTKIRHANMSLWLTADWHNPSDPEISHAPNFETTFPSHCIAESWGAQFIPQVERDIVLDRITFKKNVFSVWKGNPDFAWQFNKAVANTDGEFLVFGVAGDVCVKALLEGMKNADRKITVYLIKDCIASISETSFEQIVRSMQAAFAGVGHEIVIMNHDEIYL